MEITDFMGLLPPKSFTTDGLAKKFISVSYFIIFLWQNKDHSLSEAIIFHWILWFDRCHKLFFPSSSLYMNKSWRKLRLLFIH